MTKRKRIKKMHIVKRTRFNRDLFRYLLNKIYSCRLKISGSNKVAFPSCVMLELTNLCNLHCTTCPRQYAYGKAMDKGCMPLDKAKKIVDEIYPYLDSIGLTGLGETFLYPHLTEIASYIKSKKKSIVVSLSTNANLPNFVEKVKSVLPYIDTIQVSLDGIGDIYEQIRVDAKFDDMVENIKSVLPLTRKYHVDLMFNVVITKENYHQMGQLIKFADELGVSYLNFNYLNLVSVTEIDVDYYKFYYTEEFELALSEAYKEVKCHSNIEVTGLDLRENTGFRKCPFPWSHYLITWDGWLVPCCSKSFPKIMNFGNVYEEGVMPVLNSPQFLKFREAWRKNIHPAFCNKCHFIDL